MAEAGSRILVIEDHAALGRFIAVALAGAGWTVVGPVTDHDAALQAVRREDFDLAVMDRMLKGQDASGIADALVARGIPCLLVSGYPRSTLPERLRALAFLEKPFAMEALLAAVAALAPPRPR